VNARAVKLTEYEVAPECLTEERVAAVVGAMPRLRDRFLVMALAETGVRIGEALGLRREDMHLLSGAELLDRGFSSTHPQEVERKRCAGQMPFPAHDPRDAATSRRLRRLSR
jgi:integrase/recombinase XerD